MLEILLEEYLSNVPTLQNPKHDLYKSIKESMSFHMEGTYPEKLIEERRPYEDERIQTFRRNNYEPITKGIMQEATDSLYRIFNENYYELKTSDDLTNYINSKNFDNMTFMNWVQHYVVPRMLLDPNAVILIIPTNIVDSLTPILPLPILIDSCKIIDASQDVFTYLSDEFSLVYDGEQETHTYSGNIFYIYTKTSVYKLTQVGTKQDNKYEYIEILPHNLGFVPYATLGGNWNSNNCVYESFFNGFLPFGNDVVRLYSDMQASLITCAYPQRIIKAITCKHPECEGRGYIRREVNGNIIRDRCPSCNGTGITVPSSPYGQWIVSEEVGNEALGTSANATNRIPPITYVDAPVESLRLLNEIWNDRLEKAKESLHLELIAEAQSGTAKALDREREYAMILKISNNVFENIITFSLTAMEMYIHLNSREMPTVIKPKVFNIKTEETLIAEIEALKNTNAPLGLLQQAYKELFRKRYSGEMDTYYFYEFLIIYIPLYLNSYDTNLELLASGVVTLEMVQLAVRADTLLRQMNFEGWAITPASYKSIYEEMYKRFKESDTAQALNRTY